MDFGKYTTVFENYPPRYWLESISQLRLSCWGNLKGAYFSRDSSGTRREKACREVKYPAPGNLVYVLCLGAYLTSNIR